MSGLGSRTKKVTVYGRRKAQVVSIHTDFTASPSRSHDEAREGRSPTISPPNSALSSTFPSDATATAKRPPLQSKPSQQPIVPNVIDLTTSSPSLKATKTHKPIKAVKPVKSSQHVRPVNHAPARQARTHLRASTPDSDEIIIVRPRKVNRANKVVIPTTPSSYAPSPVRYREVLEAVVIPVHPRKPRRVVRAPIVERDDSVEPVDRELSNRLNAVSVSETLTTPTVDSITDLLAVCTSQQTRTWSEFINEITLLAQSRADSSPAEIIKVGEASYSEVYGIKAANAAGVVVKVIPLTPAQLDHRRVHRDAPDCSAPEDVKREIEITQRMSAMPEGGFVEFLKAFVVEGEYPAVLLEQWDEFKLDWGTSSIRPNCFTEKQRYAVIVLAHGGDDLEAFQFDSTLGWVEAAGVFFQVASALASAEDWTEFEHRDLHEGQILITPHPVQGSGSGSRASHTVIDFTSPSCTGVRATIIDFGLSRLALPSRAVAFTPLPEDIFEGKGEQWDVYRAMRTMIQRGAHGDDRRDGDGDWEAFHAESNVMWLHFLVRHLIHRKSLKRPKSAAVPLAPTKRIPSTSTSTSNLVAPRRGRPPKDSVARAKSERAYAVLLRMEKELEASLKTTEKGRGKRNGAGAGKMRSAADVMAFARSGGLVA